MRVIIGGNRSGKTTGGVSEGIQWSLRWPGSYGWLVTPTELHWPNIVDIVGALLPKGLAEKSGDVWTFRNGSRMELRSAYNPEDLQARGLSWFHFDEIGECDKQKAWTNLLARIATDPCPARRGKPGRGWATYTPLRYNWTHDEFELQPKQDERRFIELTGFQSLTTEEKREYWQIQERRAGMDIFRMKMADNPAVPREIIDWYKATLSEAMQKQVLYGEYVKLEGLVYDCFDRTTHIVPWLSRRPIPPDWPVYRCIDDGFSPNPWVCLLFTITPPRETLWFDMKLAPRTVLILREAYQYGLSYDETTDLMRKMYAPYAVGRRQNWQPLGWCDRTANQSIMEWNRRGESIQPPIIIRNRYSKDTEITYGIRLIYAMLRSRRLLIDADCKKLVGELESYSYDEDGKPMKKQDHGPDALRYGATMTEDPREEGLKEEPKKGDYQSDLAWKQMRQMVAGAWRPPGLNDSRGTIY